MPFLCYVCNLPYTSNGSEHVPYMTSCKKLIGKSCINKLHAKESFNNIYCCKCFEKLNKHNFYPINDIPIQVYNLLTDVSLKLNNNDCYAIEQYIIGNINNQPLFLKKFIININGTINLFDIHMKYIFIIGYSKKEIQFLKIYNITDKKLCFNGKLRSKRCTSLGINKNNNKLLEITIGYEDGVIWYKQFTLTFTSPSKMLVFNYLADKIYSISYIDNGDFVYSCGKCIRYFCAWSDNCFFEGFFNGNITEYYKIDNMKYFIDDIIFGVVDGKIFVFKKNQPIYLLCCEKNSNVINYIIDKSINRIHVFYNKYNFKKGEIWFSLLYVIYQITKEDIEFDNNKYIATPIRIFENYDKIFPISLKIISPTINCGERFMLYSFIPCIKSKNFKSINVDDKSNNTEEELNFDDLLGFFCLNDLDEILPGIIKNTICFVFKDNIKVFDFYCRYREYCPFKE